MLSVITGWSLALVLGVRHASEPDHLVAVSTLVADEANARKAAILGAVWGVGHSLSLLLVGGVLLVGRVQLPDHIADVFEFAVGLMLLVLGARSLWRARRAVAQMRAENEHGHEHIGPRTARGHTDEPGVSGRVASSRLHRPLMIGLVHGLAGSGALTALVLANMPTIGSGLVYMLCFGLGSVIGMAILTGVAGTPLRWFSGRRLMHAALGAVAGAMSLAFGLTCAWPLLSRILAA